MRSQALDEPLLVITTPGWARPANLGHSKARQSTRRTQIARRDFNQRSSHASQADRKAFHVKAKGDGKAKGDAADAAQFASIEFFDWLAFAMNRRRHERFQRMDNGN